MNEPLLGRYDLPLWLASSDHAECVAKFIGITQTLKTDFIINNDMSNATNEEHHEVLMRVAIAAKYRSQVMNNHIIRVGYMAEKLSQLMGESDDFCTKIRYAATMHEVGMIGILDSTMQKSLATNEYSKITGYMHCQIGFKILANSHMPLFKMAAIIALYYQEKFDGSGYPYKLAGYDIPVAARIVSLVKYFDSVAESANGVCVTKDFDAAREITNKAVKSFDPQLVKIFLRNINLFIELKNEINKNAHNYEHLIDYSLNIFTH